MDTIFYQCIFKNFAFNSKDNQFSFGLIKPFVPSAPFLYLLKTSEKGKVSDVFRGRERFHWKQMG